MLFRETIERRAKFSAIVALEKAGWIVAVLAPALLLTAASLRPSTAAAAETSSRAKRGEAIFQQRCVVCHNKQPGDTTPFGPPNLYGVFRGPHALTTAQARTIITNGKASMPAWGKILTSSDISNVIAYLKTR